MHPDHTHFPVLTCLSPGMLLPKNVKLKIIIKNNEEKKTQVQFGLSVYLLDQQHGLHAPPTRPPVASQATVVPPRRFSPESEPFLGLFRDTGRSPCWRGTPRWHSATLFDLFLSLSIVIRLSSSFGSSHLSHSVAHPDLSIKLKHQVFLLLLLLICTFFSCSMANFSFCPSSSS